jgi:hypothetical protein
VVWVRGAAEAFSAYAGEVAAVEGCGPDVGDEGVGEGEVFVFVVVLDWRGRDQFSCMSR